MRIKKKRGNNQEIVGCTPNGAVGLAVVDLVEVGNKQKEENWNWIWNVGDAESFGCGLHYNDQQ